MIIMYLTKENFTCPKEKICLYLPYCAETMCKCILKQYENKYKLYIVNSVNLDQLASKEAS